MFAREQSIMNDISKLTQLIKTLALQAVKQTKPLELIYGTVTQEEDEEKGTELLIKIQQKQELTKDFFIKNSKLDGLEVDNKLILLQVQGGQMFYILEVLRE